MALAGGNGQGNQSAVNAPNGNANGQNAVKTTGVPQTPPGGKDVGSVGNVPGDKHIPPGQVGNKHSEGLCSAVDKAHNGTKGNGIGRSKNGNPAHDCVNTTTTTTGGGGGGSVVFITPTTTPTTAPTAVLGETINRAPTSAGAPTVVAPTAVAGITQTAPTAATPVTALPFTGPPNVGLLAGMGFGTVMLGAGLVLAARRRPATVEA